MKLWLLRPVETWNPWYDCAHGFVVRASDAPRARAIVAETKYPKDGPGDESAKVWLDEAKTSCVEIAFDGEEEVVMRDFWAA